jgi:hypothetical protein
MATEPAEPDEWCVLETYPSASAAEADAAYLRSEMVAAEVQPIRDIPGTERGARLMVDAKLAHRARWLLKLETVSEAELEYLATGNLATTGEESVPDPNQRRWSRFMIVAVLVLAALLAILQILGTVAI